MNSTLCLLEAHIREDLLRRWSGAVRDDVLVDEAAQINFQLVKALADRATIGPRVVANYEKLSGISR